ncbi:hypothetical protein SAMN04488056_10321 [Cohaesibacter marisflavi]|uniref:Uncharacterized protein n=1 Tax=Cohaesibacter marisflavi TaxID=655353 RepID=A0A1I5E492_9HYPH|nr:hypothetical protein [Cohaesibacter marisflavi]SFO06262.1 hypothetical protein SAMN04488056_10321 [Cohaesibacter marisflavi]
MALKEIKKKDTQKELMDRIERAVELAIAATKETPLSKDKLVQCPTAIEKFVRG